VSYITVKIHYEKKFVPLSNGAINETAKAWCHCYQGILHSATATYLPHCTLELRYSCVLKQPQ